MRIIDLLNKITLSLKKIQVYFFKHFEIYSPEVISHFYSHDSYQLSDELLEWIKANRDFRNSLKLRRPKRFIKIPFLITSQTPNNHRLHKDQIIGLWYLDLKNFRSNTNPFFKQDFIINEGGKNITFLSFASKKYVKGEYVKDIADFFKIYGNNNKYYHNNLRWEHHYNNIDDLPDDYLQKIAKKIIKKQQK